MSTTERVTASLNTYRALPKVELHRHLEGSLRLDTMVDIARQHGITIPADVLRLSTLVQIQEEDKFTFQNFLAKFNTLRLFYRSPDAIHRITREAVEDAARDTITDERTGLVWQRTLSMGNHTWEGAKSYCAELGQQRRVRRAQRDGGVEVAGELA